MFDSLSLFYNMVCNTETKEKIYNKMKILKGSFDWKELDLCINSEVLKYSTFTLQDLKKHINIWEDLAKLSIDLWKDFEYYGQFNFESRYDSKEYRERLQSLGCVCEEGIWKSMSKPSEEVVEMNVFIYCVYLVLTKDVEFLCPFCEGIIKEGAYKCGGCSSLRTEIEEHLIQIERNKEKNIAFEKSIGTNKLTVETKNTDEPSIDEKKMSKEISACNDDIETKEEDAEMSDTNEKKVNLEEINETEISFKSDNLNKMTNIQETLSLSYEKENVQKNVNYSITNEGCSQNKDISDEKDEEKSYKVINDQVSLHQSYPSGASVDQRNVEENMESMKNNDRWQCINCGFLNENSNLNCSACLILSEDRLLATKNNDADSNVPKVMDHTVWECGLCHMSHSYELITCEKCSARRRDSGLWKCSVCTKVNSCGKLECTECYETNKCLKWRKCKNCGHRKIIHNEGFCEDCTKSGSKRRINHYFPFWK